MRHYDQAAIDGAIEQFVTYQRGHASTPGMTGLIARIQLDVLPSYYRAVMREINGGATPGQINKAAAALVSNIIVSLADTRSQRTPVARAAAIASFYEELAHCLEYVARADHEPGATQSVRPTPAGHA